MRPLYDERDLRSVVTGRVVPFRVALNARLAAWKRGEWRPDEELEKQELRRAEAGYGCE